MSNIKRLLESLADDPVEALLAGKAYLFLDFYDNKAWIAQSLWSDVSNRIPVDFDHAGELISQNNLALDDYYSSATFYVYGIPELVNESTLVEKIVRNGSKWEVQSEKGKVLGTYNTKKEAEERLRQIEYFKHKNESFDREFAISWIKKNVAGHGDLESMTDSELRSIISNEDPGFTIDILQTYLTSWSEGDNITVTADLLNVLEKSLDMMKLYRK